MLGTWFASRIGSSKKWTEVALFRLLKQGLSSMPFCLVSEEHQKSYVSFQDSKTGFKPVTCEISDLYIIYTDQNESRHTFLQNKYIRSTIKNSLYAVSSQWYLLSARPQINPKNTPFSKDIFSTALLPSIGSYGVFYQMGSFIDMDYTSADLLTCSSSKIISSKNYASLTNTGKTGKIRNGKGRNELERASNLNLFDLAGRAMLIGSPIDKSNETWPYIKRIIAGTIKEYQENPKNVKSLSPDEIRTLKTRFEIDDNFLRAAPPPPFSVAIVMEGSKFLFKCKNQNEIRRLSLLLGTKFQDMTNCPRLPPVTPFSGVDMSRKTNVIFQNYSAIIDEEETETILKILPEMADDNSAEPR